jgi:hypothetical protein
MMRENYKLQPATDNMRVFMWAALFCVAVPGLASLKSVVIFGLWTYFFLAGQTRVRSVIWFLSVLLNLTFWCEVALLHGVPQPDMWNQFGRTLVFFLILGIGGSTISSGTMNVRKLDSLIVRIATTSALLKVGIMVAVLSGKFTLENIQKALGYETVTEGIDFGLQRLQFPSDIIIIFLVACYVGGRRRTTDLLLLLGTTIVVFLSFSRYLFAAYVLCIFLRTFRLRKLDTISRTGILLAGILVVVFFASLALRFTGSDTHDSDAVRNEQIRKLDSVISQHMLFGTGIGSSVNSYKRSETIPFSYEVQWYALTMQFGFLGLFWLVGNLMSPITGQLKTGREGIFACSVFLLWVIAGFTNPFIISLGSAFGLCILMLSIAERQESPSSGDPQRMVEIRSAI